MGSRLGLFGFPRKQAPEINKQTNIIYINAIVLIDTKKSNINKPKEKANNKLVA